VSEDTPIGEVMPILRSALVAEEQTDRLHISDAGRALVSALSLPSGIHNVCRDGGRVSTERFTQAAGRSPQQ
jgi:hypothetical protein